MSTTKKQQLCYELSPVASIQSFTLSLKVPEDGNGVVTGTATIEILGNKETALMIGNVKPDQDGFLIHLDLEGGQAVPGVKSIKIDLNVDSDWNGENASYTITFENGKQVNGQGPATKIDC